MYSISVISVISNGMSYNKNKKIIKSSLLPFSLPSYHILILAHLKLSVTFMTHTFKWVKITHICLT